jgi:hypothetical protein
MPLKRLPDWRFRLGQMIDSAAELSFAWGTFDCALHVCNCIRAITGSDPALEYRGKYQDEAGAAALYGSSLETFIEQKAAQLGCEEISVTFAHRGDVVFVDNGTSQGALAVVCGDGRFASCAGEKGLVLVRMERWRRAWKIG